MSDTISGVTVKEGRRSLTGEEAKAAALRAFRAADWLSVDQVADAVPVTRRTARALVREFERAGLIAADSRRRCWTLSARARQQR